MNKSSRRPHRVRWIALILLASLALAAIALFATMTGSSLSRVFAAPDQARSTVMTAYRQVQNVGAYQFSSDISQEIIPLATAGNVGRSSKTQRVYIEGETDLAARTLQLALWSQGGSVMDASTAAQIKVEGEKAFTRQGESDWQETENFTGGFAPGGDFLTFL
ncbi:MAG: hypothetical protein KDH90_23160, partial [Anaerolineae bacterium]|nr:hypothetical protein [Anaerolineae bacterium]